MLILDEPTQGVDVGAKAEIHALMGELAAQGVAILMISSELPEILGMSDRIVVMHGGRLAGVLDRAEATQEGILALALGEHGRGSRALDAAPLPARARGRRGLGPAARRRRRRRAVLLQRRQPARPGAEQRAAAGRRGRDDARDPRRPDRHLDRLAVRDRARVRRAAREGGRRNAAAARERAGARRGARGASTACSWRGSGCRRSSSRWRRSWPGATACAGPPRARGCRTCRRTSSGSGSARRAGSG